jgi:hypothetical protein
MKAQALAVVSIAGLLAGCVYEPQVHEVRGSITGDLIRTIEGPSDNAGGVRVSGVQTFDRWGRAQDSQFFAGPGMAQTSLGAAVGAAGFVAGSMGGAALLRPAKIGGTTNTLTQTGGAVSNLATSAGSTANAAGGAGGKGGKGGAGGAGGVGGTSSSFAAGGSGGASQATGGTANAQGGSATSSSKSGATAASSSSANASVKSLNQASFQFHTANSPGEGGTTCKGNCAPHEKDDEGKK